MFLSSCRNTSESLEEGEILWELEAKGEFFLQLFHVLSNFQETFKNSIEILTVCFLFLLENTPQQQKNNLFTLMTKM